MILFFVYNYVWSVVWLLQRRQLFSVVVLCVCCLVLFNLFDCKSVVNRAEEEEEEQQKWIAESPQNSARLRGLFSLFVCAFSWCPAFITRDHKRRTQRSGKGNELFEVGTRDWWFVHELFEIVSSSILFHVNKSTFFLLSSFYLDWVTFQA